MYGSSRFNSAYVWRPGSHSFSLTSAYVPSWALSSCWSLDHASKESDEVRVLPLVVQDPATSTKTSEMRGKERTCEIHGFQIVTEIVWSRVYIQVRSVNPYNIYISHYAIIIISFGNIPCSSKRFQLAMRANVYYAMVFCSKLLQLNTNYCIYLQWMGREPESLVPGKFRRKTGLTRPPSLHKQA